MLASSIFGFFFGFFVFLGLFSPSARYFLFGALVDPYPPGVMLGLGTILAMQTELKLAVRKKLGTTKN